MLGTANYFTDWFIFGMLVNVSKKIVCLQLKVARDIDCGYDIIIL